MRRPLSYASIAVAAIAFSARAAVPGPFQALPNQVVGVIVSGGQTGLRLKEGDLSRTLHLGEVYVDGWRLSDLTDSAATFVKGGEKVRIGLNPAGTPPVRVTSPPSEKAFGAVGFRAERQFSLSQPGLTLEETRRLEDLQTRVSQMLSVLTATPLVQSKMSNPEQIPPEGRMSRGEIIAALGPDGVNFDELMKKRYDAALQGYREVGPVSIVVSRANDMTSAIARAGLDRTLYTSRTNFVNGQPVSVTLSAVPPPPLMGDYADMNTLRQTDPNFDLDERPGGIVAVSKDGAISWNSANAR